MTGHELIDALARQPLIVSGVLAALVGAAWAVGRAQGSRRAGDAPWRYLYATLLYAAAVPGVLAALLTAYSILFLRADLLAVSPLVYLGPILAMTLTVALVRRQIRFDEIPGAGRLAGSVLLIALSFAILYFLSRLFVGVVFFGSVGALLALAVILFALLRLGTSLALRDR